jgi:hypothetical protein
LDGVIQHAYAANLTRKCNGHEKVVEQWVRAIAGKNALR